MCGIAGLWNTNLPSGDDLSSQIDALTDALHRRGPDGRGTWFDVTIGIALGQRRLSIIDLSTAGAQPMTSGDGRWVLTFNGEIYNFSDLRSELQDKGIVFRGSSDTEVLLEAVACYGVEAALAKLNGMFAIGLWDRQSRQLWLARDRMGEKPLYWARVGGRIVFGSELKALRQLQDWHPEINSGAIAALLRHNYVPGTTCIYLGVEKVAPGGFVVIEPHSERRGRFWNLGDAARQARDCMLSGDEAELIDELQALLSDAVQRRMVSDVPLGAFLSGGSDSSLIVAIMQKLSSQPVRTFTVGFERRALDESPYAEAVAYRLGTQHTTFRVSAEDALAVVPKLSEMYDEPFADSSQIPTHIVSALTRQHATVALSGDGGDELFAGYDRYGWADRLWGYCRKVPAALRPLASKLAHSIPEATIDAAFSSLPKLKGISQAGKKIHRVADFLSAASIDDLYRMLVSHHATPAAWVTPQLENVDPVWQEDLSGMLPDGIDRMRYRDMLTYLPDDILTKVDRASMSVGLEVRVPLLDHRVVEWSWRLPVGLNSRAARPKHLLRKLLGRYIPPDLTERPKMGFGVPLAEWLRGPLREWAADLLQPDALRREGVLSPQPIQVAWATLLAGSDQPAYLLWTICMYQSWLRRWSAPQPGS